jgi:hypothetical protein
MYYSGKAQLQLPIENALCCWSQHYLFQIVIFKNVMHFDVSRQCRASGKARTSTSVGAAAIGKVE